jgi:hypothetical protein
MSADTLSIGTMLGHRVLPHSVSCPRQLTLRGGFVLRGLYQSTTPAQRSSTWLPLAATPSDVEQCYGENGILYVYLLTTGKGYRQPPG